MVVESPPRKSSPRPFVPSNGALTLVRPDVVPAAAPSRILVVSLDNLGDLVFTSLLTRQLRLHFPAAHITLWCKRYTASIAPLLPGVDRVEHAEPFWDRAPGGRKGELVPFLLSLLRLRRERFDVAVLAAAPWRTAAASSFAGATRRIGARQRKNARWLTDALPAQDIRKPVLAEMMRLLAPLGIETPPELFYQLDAAPLASRRARLAPLLGGHVAALHPFASLRNRCVALREWVRTAAELDARGYDPLWIGSPAELREIHATPGASAWASVDQVGDGSIADTAAAISLAQLFVGHDSGPLHIAGALGIPVLGVFTPGEPARTFPQGTGQSRMLVRSTPAGVRAEDFLEALGPLAPMRALALV